MCFRTSNSGWRLTRPVLALLLLASSLPARPAPVLPAREYLIKAVFLFNFSQFIEWPAAAFPTADTPLVIGVLGDDPFGSALDETVHGETAGSRPLVTRRFRRLEEIEDCHILFISRSEDRRLEQITAHLMGRAVLTVSDTEGAAQRGVMIRFSTENKRIRLRIDLGAARTAGLVISSKLLRPAEIVSGKELIQ